MKFTVKNVRYSPHDLDAQCAYFYFDIHITEPEEYFIKKYFLSYSRLLDYIRQKYPEFYAYLSSVRESIDRWGTREIETLDAVGDEAINTLYKYLVEYLQQSTWIEKLYENEKMLDALSLEEQHKMAEGAEKITRELGGMASAFKQADNKYFRFCETVERQIRATAAEVFPELVDGDAEQLMEFKHLFVRDIQSMYDRIEKMKKKYKK